MPDVITTKINAENIITPNTIVNNPPLVHGGQLHKIAKQHAIPIEQWLDLSTGIAPVSYAIPAIPAEVWQILPQPSDALQKAASSYYQTKHLLPIAGSQVVIQILPQIAAQQGYANSRVWLPSVGYKEHQKAWQGAGYNVMFYQSMQDIKTLHQQDIVVLINPNNPSGKTYSHAQVAQLFNLIEQKSGLLIIDEAFMDCTPQHSFIGHTNNPRLIVLRSVGKFFGLAGLRLGFVAASPDWLKRFETYLGPWSINGPAQYVGQQALADKPWQMQQRERLNSQSLQLAELLEKTFKQAAKGTALFQTIQCEQAVIIFDQLCQQGVYVRLCDEKNALRFGIPKTHDFSRLQTALDNIIVQNTKPLG